MKWLWVVVIGVATFFVYQAVAKIFCMELLSMHYRVRNRITGQEKLVSNICGLPVWWKVVEANSGLLLPQKD